MGYFPGREGLRPRRGLLSLKDTTACPARKGPHPLPSAQVERQVLLLPLVSGATFALPVAADAVDHDPTPLAPPTRRAAVVRVGRDLWNEVRHQVRELFGVLAVLRLVGRGGDGKPDQAAGSVGVQGKVRAFHGSRDKQPGQDTAAARGADGLLVFV